MYLVRPVVIYYYLVDDAVMITEPQTKVGLLKEYVGAAQRWPRTLGSSLDLRDFGGIKHDNSRSVGNGE